MRALRLKPADSLNAFAGAGMAAMALLGRWAVCYKIDESSQMTEAAFFELAQRLFVVTVTFFALGFIFLARGKGRWLIPCWLIYAGCFILAWCVFVPTYSK